MRPGTASLTLRSYGGEVRLHAHDHHQIVLPCRGILAMRVGTLDGTVDEEKGVMVVGDTPHAFASPGENCFIVLDLPRGGMLPDRALDVAAAAPFFAIDAPLFHLLRFLEGTAASGHLDRPATHHAVGLLSAAILRQVAAPRRYPKPIERALELAHAESETPPGVVALARAAGMGLSRFHEAFRDAVGRTPGDYLAELRLDRAADLLRHGEMPIAEVALAVGFSDQSALTRALRRRRGVTPSELRAELRRAPRA